MPPILNLGGASFTLGATFGICRGGSISGWVRKPEKWRRLECLRGSSGWKPLPFCAAKLREGHTSKVRPKGDKFKWYPLKKKGH